MSSLNQQAYTPVWIADDVDPAISRDFAREQSRWRFRGRAGGSSGVRFGPVSRRWLGTALRRTTHVALSVIGAVMILIAIAALAVALYWIKSRLGIDLLPGPSPMHAVLYSG